MVEVVVVARDGGAWVGVWPPGTVSVPVDADEGGDVLACAGAVEYVAGEVVVDRAVALSCCLTEGRPEIAAGYTFSSDSETVDSSGSVDGRAEAVGKVVAADVQPPSSC